MSLQTKATRWPTWLVMVIIVLLIFNGLPFLAPVFMKLGWAAGGNAIYFIYGFLCHQMAQRSFFLFGPQGFQMYNISQLPVNASGPTAAWTLRLFIGNEAMGWKVAWSDRMVYMYTSPLLVAVIYGFLRQRGPVKPLSLLAFGLLLLPMALDGGTHFLSDIAGIGHGFRDSNLWLAVLTNHALPQWFYSGDALGSFNSWMRLISGLTFGVAVGGLMFPYIDIAAAPPAESVMLIPGDQAEAAHHAG